MMLVLRLAAAMAGVLVAVAPAGPAAAQAVDGYGNVRPWQGAKEPPSPDLRYRVVFDISKAAQQPARVNPGLDRVARFLNLLAREGIRPAQRDVVAIIHGPATTLVLEENAYGKRHGVPNPNLELIRRLKAAGVSVRVCSQALAARRIAAADVAEAVQIDVAGVTTLANLQLRGFALIPE